MSLDNLDNRPDSFELLCDHNRSQQESLLIRVYHYGQIFLRLRTWEDGRIVVRQNLCESKNRLTNILLAQLWVSSAFGREYSMCEEWDTRDFATKDPYNDFELSLEEDDDTLYHVINDMVKSEIQSAEMLGERLLIDFENENHLKFIVPTEKDLDELFRVAK